MFCQNASSGGTVTSLPTDAPNAAKGQERRQHDQARWLRDGGNANVAGRQHLDHLIRELGRYVEANRPRREIVVQQQGQVRRSHLSGVGEVAARPTHVRREIVAQQRGQVRRGHLSAPVAVAIDGGHDRHLMGCGIVPITQADGACRLVVRARAGVTDLTALEGIDAIIKGRVEKRPDRACRIGAGGGVVQDQLAAGDVLRRRRW